jgi:hypothetical protein
LGHWLVAPFTIFGIELQPWMLVAVAIVLIGSLPMWRR